MKLLNRVGVIVAVVGVGLLLAALNYPSSNASTESFGTTQPDINSIFFLIPQHYSVIVDSLNGSAFLIVARSDPQLNAQTPILNTSVQSKDVIFFDIAQRGFYFIYFEPVSPSVGSGSAVSFDLHSEGIPTDLALAGIIFTAVGVLISLVSVFSRRSNLFNRYSSKHKPLSS
jgi:hypothetical protein